MASSTTGMSRRRFLAAAGAAGLGAAVSGCPAIVRAATRRRMIVLGIKVVSALLRHLPAGREYLVVFMLRNLGDVLASQARMLGIEDDAGAARMRACFETHLGRVRRWIGEREGMAVLYVGYEDVLARPLRESGRVAAFLGAGLHPARMMGGGTARVLGWSNRVQMSHVL